MSREANPYWKSAMRAGWLSLSDVSPLVPFIGRPRCDHTGCYMLADWVSPTGESWCSDHAAGLPVAPPVVVPDPDFPF